MHVCALEVPNEDPNQVTPVVDLRGRKVLEPGSRRVRQEQGEIADDEQVIVRATQLAGQAVIGKPELRVGLAAVLREIGRLPEPGGKKGSADGPAEDPRAWRFRGRTAVLPAIVATTSVWVVAPSGPLVVVASSPADHLMVSLHLALVAEAVKQQGDPVGYRCLSGLRMNRGFPILPRRCRGQLREAPVPLGGGTLGLLNRGGL